jgi:uncharacterized protein (DUF2249 family)
MGMDISEHTKISELIRANPASIKAIASINRHFEKLNNPVLRRILASRVTIADAARIGKCSVQDFYDKLIPLGFRISRTGVVKSDPADQGARVDFTRTIDPSSIVRLDVRDMIRENKDPFNVILAALAKLEPGQVLLLVNSFEPVPLLRILGSKGYRFEVRHVLPDLVETWILPGDAIDNAGQSAAADEALFERTKTGYGGKLVTIDVRPLEMPGPMMAILRELDNLPEEHALFVLHKRVPQFLFPELQQRRFRWLTLPVSEREVHLLVYK